MILKTLYIEITYKIVISVRTVKKYRKDKMLKNNKQIGTDGVFNYVSLLKDGIYVNIYL